MEQEQLTQITASIQDKFPDAGVRSIEVDEGTGKATFMLNPTPTSLAYLEQGGVVPKVYRGREQAATINRDYVQRQNLDLMQLAGFCRNCLAKWYRAEAADRDIQLSDEEAREIIYGMPYPEWKQKYQR